MKPKDNKSTIRSRRWRAKRAHMVNKSFLISQAAAAKIDDLKEVFGVRSDRAAIEILLKRTDPNDFHSDIFDQDLEG